LFNKDSKAQGQKIAPISRCKLQLKILTYLDVLFIAVGIVETQRSNNKHSNFTFLYNYKTLPIALNKKQTLSVLDTGVLRTHLETSKN
jgi:hypothetical protein